MVIVRDPLWYAIPAAVLGAIALVPGLYIPAGLWQLLNQAAQLAGGR